MIENIIKKDIEKITLEDAYNLYNIENIATVKVADNILELVQE